MDKFGHLFVKVKTLPIKTTKYTIEYVMNDTGHFNPMFIEYLTDKFKFDIFPSIYKEFPFWIIKFARAELGMQNSKDKIYCFECVKGYGEIIDKKGGIIDFIYDFNNLFKNLYIDLKSSHNQHNKQ